jgi:glycosyltransferase involved in cell wall biosynthesis
MTTWLEPGVSEGERDRALGVRWRAEATWAQEVVLPPGRIIVSCAAPFGVGGLGRHLHEILAALDRGKRPRTCICGSTRGPRVRTRRRRLSTRALNAVLELPPMRLAAARRAREYSIEFDDYAAQQLSAADHLIAFNGMALAQFQAARRSHIEGLALMSANPHMRCVIRQHARAYRQYPIEGSWATRLLERNLVEYAQADRIYVASRYAWESFIEEGFPEEKLSLFPLTPDPRYSSDGAPPTSTTFDIVFVGRLTVTKGVPLLIDAVRRLEYADLRLHLVGGWGSRGMRRFIEEARACDSRIDVGAGDPLPHLRAARLFVHPTFEDGFAYAPAEALACGVPAIVSEDTGMKELIDAGRNGLILPTGDLSALIEAIEAAYRGEILSG